MQVHVKIYYKTKTNVKGAKYILLKLRTKHKIYLSLDQDDNIDSYHFQFWMTTITSVRG